MNTTVLQVPINIDLRKRVDQMAENQGFSSAQEVVGVFLSRFAAGKIEVEFFPQSNLSSLNERKYKKMLKQPVNSQKQFGNVEDLMESLNVG